MNKIEVQKKFDEINDQLDILHAIFEKFFRQKILKLEEESSLYFKKLCYSIPRQNK